MSKLFSFTLALLLALSLGVAASPAQASGKFTKETAQKNALTRINAMRSEAGLPPVTLHPAMTAHAQKMAEDWARGKRKKEIWDYNHAAMGTDAFVNWKDLNGCRDSASKPGKMALGTYTFTKGTSPENTHLAVGWAKIPKTKSYIYVVYTFGIYE